MAEEKRKPDVVTRRKFVIGAGAAMTSGVVGGVIGSQLFPREVERVVEVVKADVPKSGYIHWNPEECAACSRCMMTCAVYHDGAVAPQLSRVIWKEEDFLYGFRHRRPLFCQQCAHPECYFACPLKDAALCIDSATGARYINVDRCDGCGICVDACPFEVPRINLDLERKVAIKCDLCKDRPGGPACAEVCDREAITFVSKEER